MTYQSSPCELHGEDFFIVANCQRCNLTIDCNRSNPVFYVAQVGVKYAGAAVLRRFKLHTGYQSLVPIAQRPLASIFLCAG